MLKHCHDEVVPAMAFLAQIIDPVEVNFYSVALDQVNLPRRKFKNFTCKTPGKFTWLGGGDWKSFD